MKKNQDDIINYFINGRYRNYSVIYLSQSFYKVPGDIRNNYSHFCIFHCFPRKQREIARELGLEDLNMIARATREPFSFFYFGKPRNLIKKNFDETI